MLHRPRITADEEDTDEGLALIWRVLCCHATQHLSYFRQAQAQDALAGHLDQIAPPETERCHDTTAHRTRWWDACLLCAAQDPLPGFATPRKQGVSS